MAGNESTTENVPKEAVKQPNHPHETGYSLIRLTQILVPVIGVFAALCYFLGRLQIEAYYYALGITPHVLHFTPEDYMFSSLNLVIICASVSYWLYTYYSHKKAGEKMLFGFPTFQGSSKSDIINNIFMIVLALVFTVSTFLNIYLEKGVGANVPGFLGLSVGFAIGIVVILYLWLLETIYGKRATYVGLVIVGLLLLAGLPSIASNLAKIEAKSDIEKFPNAVLICEDVLNPQLQSSPQNPRASTEVKVITTNNGMTYVLKQDSESTNEWQIYAIREDDIKQVIYLHEK